MKKCPKCKAEIQENARFCLFCMTSFEEKQAVEAPKEQNKRWLYTIAAVLMLVFIILSVVVLAQSGKTSNNKNDISYDTSANNSSMVSSSSNAEFGSNGAESSINNTTSLADPSVNQSSNEESEKGNTTSTVSSVTSNSSQTQTSSNNQSTTQGSSNTSSSNTSTNTSNTASSTTSGTSSTNTSTGSDVSSSTSSSNISTPQVIPKYSYITATNENTYPTGSNTTYHPNNAIVITKIDYVEPSGIYVIPDTIDGKKVAAIMPSAFSSPEVSSTVTSVTLPVSVKTVWSKAFEKCYNLKDLYFKSSTIAIYEDAFPDIADRKADLVLHCKIDCKDFDYYLYRNIAHKYGATYQEWNG